MSNELKLDYDRLDRQAQMLKALAHPIRISIVQLLNGTAILSVSEIQERLGIEQSVASHHLGILRDKGLLLSKREGKNIRYTLKYEKLSVIVECINSCNENI